MKLISRTMLCSAGEMSRKRSFERQITRENTSSAKGVRRRRYARLRHNAGVQSADERGLVDYTAAGHVDDARAPLHLAECVVVEDALQGQTNTEHE